MQGLGVTWDFLVKTLRPMAAQYLREDTAGKVSINRVYGENLELITTVGGRVELWRGQKSRAERRRQNIFEDFLKRVEDNPETRFLLVQHSADDIDAGNIANPFFGHPMPSKDEFPNIQYPAQPATVFPVPLDLRKELILDYVDRIALRMCYNIPYVSRTVLENEPTRLFKPATQEVKVDVKVKVEAWLNTTLPQLSNQEIRGISL